MGKENCYDVIVAGGGMAGCSAAISAAESGSKTLLIEQFGYLGGWATAALVNPFMPHWASDGKTLVAGIFKKISDMLDDAGGRLANAFDAEALEFGLQEMVIASGANIRLHTFADQLNYTDDGNITVHTISKSGSELFCCKRLIDCTGDGDLAVSLGAKFELGGDDGIPQAATLMFDVGGVDVAKALEYVKDHPDQVRFPKFEPDADIAKISTEVFSVAGYYDLISRAKAAGEYNAPGDLLLYFGRPRKGEVTFNTTHIGNVDGTNADDLTRAEIEGRRQMMSIVAFVKKYVPGFENSYLLRTPVHVGIRETRRIVGLYKFSADDVVNAHKFEDGICRLAYPVDVHSGKGEGYTKEEETHTVKTAPHGDWYDIPYRCLIPEGIDGVLVAGRCASSTQEGHGAIRIMPACAAMGEAAGVAASISLKKGIPLKDVDPVLLKTTLRQRGALL
ncbi:FAD-dependent oxidoreductase [bacterium]|nr:FAD-dependent oxidoreductase [bacterium]